MGELELKEVEVRELFGRINRIERRTRMHKVEGGVKKRGFL